MKFGGALVMGSGRRRVPLATAGGWTTGGAGGTVTQAATLALSVAAGQYGGTADAYIPRAYRAHGRGTQRVTLRARLASLTPAGAAAQVYAWLGIGNGTGAGQGPWAGVLVRGDGLVELAVLSGAGGLAETVVQSAPGALPLDGSGWVEVEDGGGVVEVRYRTGAAAWVCLGSYAPTRAELGGTYRPDVVARLTQWTDQGAQSCAWGDITVKAGS